MPEAAEPSGCVRADTVDGAPKVVPFAANLHKNLVEVSPPEARPHTLDAAFADFRSE